MFTTYQKNAIFFSCLILVTGLMAIDFINPSLPYIMKSLNATQHNTKLLIVFYMIGLGLSQFIYGTFSDNYGRKKTIIISYGIAILGMLLSSIANSMEMLYVARVITGIGSGGAPIIARAIISDVCKEQTAIKKGFSYFSMSSQLSPALAPTVGGLIQENFNWRICFLALLALTLVSGVIIKIFMPETHSIPEKKTSLTQQFKLYFSLFKLKRFMLYNFLSAFIFVFTIAYYSYMPFILFKYNFTPVENGAIYIVYAISIILGSLCLAKYLAKFCSKKIFIACCCGYLTLSIGFYIYFNYLYSVIAILILSGCIAFLCGIAAPLSLSLCMYGFDKNKGAASAVQSFIKMFFTGVALLLFNFINLQSMLSLLECYIILSAIVIILVICDINSMV